MISRFVTEHQSTTLGWYHPFLTYVVQDQEPLFAASVLLMQLGAGLSLVLGRRVVAGLFAGIFLNLHFLAAGAVTPSAFYLLAQGALALWLMEKRPLPELSSRLGYVAAVGGILAGLSLPFISTIHPEEVIDDPAIMFAFAGTLTAVTCLAAVEQATRRAQKRAAALATVRARRFVNR